MAQFPGVYNSPYDNTIAALIARQGDIAGESAARSGAIWGRAIENVGQIAGAEVERRQGEKKQQEREARFNAALQSWDGKDPMALYRGVAPIIGPEAALKTAQAMKAMAEAKEVSPEGFAVKVGALRALKDKLGPDWLGRNWAGVAPILAGEAQTFLNVDLGQLPPEEAIGALDALDERLNPKKGRAAHVVKGALVSDTGDVLYQAPPEAPETPKTPTLDQALMAAYQGGDQAEVDRLLALKGREAAVTRAPKEAGKPTLTPTAEASVINRLSTQWTKATESARELSRQQKIMGAGLEAAKRGDLASGSQAVLVTFQKILDPTSVVRESEYMRSAAGQSYVNQIVGKLEQAVKGGTGVPLSELQKYVRLADEILATGGSSLRTTRERIGKTADRYNIPHDVVLEGDWGTEPKADMAGGGKKAGRVGKYTFEVE